jgi:hypothetical protein
VFAASPNNLDYAASLLEAAALAEKHDRIEEIADHITNIVEVQAPIFFPGEEKASLYYRLLVGFYEVWAQARREEPVDEKLATWRQLVKEAKESGVAFSGFWSLAEARHFLETNGTVTSAQKRLLVSMIETMEGLGASAS